jgi:transposase
MLKVIMYQKLRKLKQVGHTASSIASLTGLDIKTVKKYESMSEEEYQQYYQAFRQRVKCFDIYEDEIIKIHQQSNNRKVCASAIYDLLEERYGDLPATERSFRNYMAYLRLSGKLTPPETRIYESVEQLPLGKQLQVDFGQYKMRNGIKYYIFAAILSSSRCRYVKIFQRPLNTLDLIQSLNDCFLYYGGMPSEVVIDQDRLMVVDENRGDIILTKDFKAFKDEMGFNLYVCRKADPESKGKVENLVNFVKRSFFTPRAFSSLEEAQERLSKWLIRKANGKRCAATGQIPWIHLEEERKHLKPIKNSIFAITDKNLRELRKVDKLGQISVKGKKLQVPHEYRLKTVSVFISAKEIYVFDPVTDEKLAIYALRTGISKKLIVRQKSLRNAKYNQLKNDLCSRFHFKKWNLFVEKNFHAFRRYFQDQYQDFFRKATDLKDVTLLEKAVDYCLKNGTYSMSQLYDTYQYLLQGNKLETNAESHSYKLVSGQRFNAPSVATRSVNEYLSLISEKAEVNNA